MALVVAVFTLVTAIVFHNKFTDPDQIAHFLKNLSIIGGLLQVAAFGGGALSLDARRINKSRALNRERYGRHARRFPVSMFRRRAVGLYANLIQKPEFTEKMEEEMKYLS
jgi:hypothetical protein